MTELAPTEVWFRPIQAADFDHVLGLNAANVESLAPLDANGLAALLPLADTAAVIMCGDAAAGFVITMADGEPYRSPNYRWFSARHERFVYLDRIVVDPQFRRRGVAGAAYELIEAAAATHCGVMCLEVNLEPRNEASLRFHARRGFVEVGQQDTELHPVMLLEKAL